MTTPKWTSPQKRAIETIGRDVLVTASAGTGKTAVLSQRCVERICDPMHPVDADRLLVLTFTEAAAEEMKTRIAEKLSAAFESEGSGRLRRQLVLLDAAYIGTIHGFCKRILAEYFYLSGLDPRFGILDPDQRDIIRVESMNEALELAWNDESLAVQLQALFDGRNLRNANTSLPASLLWVANYLDSLPSREAFYQSALKAVSDDPDSRQTMNKMMCEGLSRHLQTALDRLHEAQRRDHLLTGGQYLSDYIDLILSQLHPCLMDLNHGKLASAAAALCQADFGRMPSLSKKLDVDKASAETIKIEVTQGRDAIKKLKDLVFVHPEYIAAIAPRIQSQTEACIALLRLFDQRYARRKQALNVLDFADLEHQMLLLLQDQTVVGQKLRERFEYVFIDEYQDINSVQREILRQVSRPGNLFVVGDVKQSIYAFRQSRPEIFLEQLAAAADDPAAADLPLRVDMNHNFRSRQEVLTFANRVFGRIMTQAVAGLDYDKRSELIAGLNYPPLEETSADRVVELHLLDEDNPEDKKSQDEDAQEDTESDENQDSIDTITAVQRQAAMIARRIRQMVGTDTGRPEFQVYDKSTGTMRDVRYSDIVILMRALSHRAAEYVELLRLAGIPVSSQNQCGYFAATEVADCIALCKTLDNPLQDIELAALLRSALFRFTDSQLAAMRLFANQKKHNDACFYDVLAGYSQDGPETALRQKAAAALDTLESWRRQSRRTPLSELLWRIYESTSLLAFVSALPNGRQRRANLLKLHDRAIQYESFADPGQGRSVSGFAAFLEKLLEQENDWAPAQPDNFAENTVRIMSVHKSKGLEFPVIILAELNWPMRKQDSAGPCMVNAEMLGLELLDPQRGLRLATPIHQLIRMEKQRANLAEEMRILYVAMTRARDRLILTASTKLSRCQDRIERSIGFQALPEWELLGATSHLDWLLAALAESDALRAICSAEQSTCAQDELFSVSSHDKIQLNQLSDSIRRQKQLRDRCYQPVTGQCSNPQNRRLLEQAVSLLNWQYPDDTLTRLPGKFSVTGLTHRDDEFSRPQLDETFTLPRPRTTTAEPRAEAMARGHATHLVFQYLPLTSMPDRAVVLQTIEKLVDCGQLTLAQSQSIDVDTIISFFQTPAGILAIQNAERVYREWPFTMALPVSELGLSSSEEFVVVQGVIDLLIPTDKGLVLVDFKTDKIDENKIDSRTARYQPQLALYARAAETILKIPAAAGFLYFLHPRVLQPVEISHLNLKSVLLSDQIS
ncbi:MAG: helicase-exonuclease AddAB subunit AddA [Sedimentisphaerales bacterium]|nr:helicase-exonuclease AddAB subunit AddA [Sedimentisphaerales bacterium]